MFISIPKNSVDNSGSRDDQHGTRGQRHDATQDRSGQLDAGQHPLFVTVENET